MAQLDQQLMVKNESTWGTPVTPDRTYEFNSEGIEDQFGRTEGDPLRVGTFYQREDRFTPYLLGVAGPIEMDVMTKGFGWWLKHMFGTVNTTGPTETTVYTHTAVTSDLLGTSFTAQVSRPLNPTGTAQPFTYEGCKITEWELSNSVDGNLVFTATIDGQQVSTATALATASYPTSMENLTWAGGTVSIAGTQVPVTEVSIKASTGLNTDRRKINGSTDKQEQTGGRREASFSLSADFDALTQRNRAASATAAGAMAQIICTWTGPTLLGSTIKPNLVVTMQARFDEFKAANEGPEGITQELSGALRYAVSPAAALTAVYQSADVTA